MGDPGLGLKEYIQWGYENPWNTAVAATKRNRVVSIDPRPEKGIIRSRAMNNTIVQTGIYAGGTIGRATVEFELEYENFGGLLDFMMGTQAYGANGGTTSGVGPYTHTWRNGMPEEFLNSMTLQMIHGNIPTGKCHRLSGAKVKKATFRGSGGLAPQPVSLTVEFVGGTFLTNQTPTGALTAPATPLPVLMGHRSTFDDGTTDSAGNLALQEFELTIENELTDPRFDGANIIEPVRDNHAKVSFRYRTEFQTVTALDHYLGLTQGDPTLVFTDSTRVLTFDMPKGYIVAHGHPQQGAGRIFQDFTWEAIDDGGSPPTGLLITLTNSESAIV